MVEGMLDVEILRVCRNEPDLRRTEDALRLFGGGGQVTLLQPLADLLKGHAAVEQDGDPSPSADMVPPEIARLLRQEVRKHGVGELYIEDVDSLLPLQPQLFPRHVHDERKQLGVVAVAVHRVVRIPQPEPFRLRTVLRFDVSGKLLPPCFVHRS